MLRQRSSLDLSRVTDLTQLERDASPAGRLALAAPVAAPAQMAPAAGLGLALPAAGAGSTAERAESAESAYTKLATSDDFIQTATLRSSAAQISK